MNWTASSKALVELLALNQNIRSVELTIEEPEPEIASAPPEPEVMTTALFGWS